MREQTELFPKLMDTSSVIQFAEDWCIWCEMATLEIEPYTSDLKASQPLTTS